MKGFLIGAYVALGLVASVVYPEEARRRWADFGGVADSLVTFFAVLLWPIPLAVLAWLLLRERYRTWRNPVPDTPEELHDER